MGVLNFLVSDATNEYFEFGKILWPSEVTTAMRKGDNLEEVIRKAILDEEYNSKHDNDEAKSMALRATEWIKLHPDWRTVADCDEDYDDIYLASSVDDGNEYLDEFGDDAGQIYTKTGSVWDDR